MSSPNGVTSGRDLWWNADFFPGEELRRNKFVALLKQWIEPTCLLLFPTLQIICNFTQRLWKRSFSKRYGVQVFSSNLFVGFSCSCPFPVWNCMYHLLILEFQLMCDEFIYCFELLVNLGLGLNQCWFLLCMLENY